MREEDIKQLVETADLGKAEPVKVVSINSSYRGKSFSNMLEYIQKLKKRIQEMSIKEIANVKRLASKAKDIHIKKRKKKTIEVPTSPSFAAPSRTPKIPSPFSVNGKPMEDDESMLNKSANKSLNDDSLNTTIDEAIIEESYFSSEYKKEAEEFENAVKEVYLSDFRWKGLRRKFLVIERSISLACAILRSKLVRWHRPFAPNIQLIRTSSLSCLALIICWIEK